MIHPESNAVTEQRAVTGYLSAVRERYEEYLSLVGKATFVDITRRTDPGRTGQPWQALSLIADEFGCPQVVSIWTKGPRDVLRRGRPLLERLRRDGATIICQFSATGFGPEIEPYVPWPVDWEGIREMIEFLGTPEALLWRYDPIIPGLSDEATLEHLVDNFARLGLRKAVYNRGECGMGLVRDRLGSDEGRIDQAQDMNAFSRKIEEAGKARGIEFSTLAEGEKLDARLNLSSRCCSQYEWLARVSDGFPPRDFLPGAVRSGCICAPSFDVGIEGQFETCYKCVYCFAP